MASYFVVFFMGIFIRAQLLYVTARTHCAPWHRKCLLVLELWIKDRLKELFWCSW